MDRSIFDMQLCRDTIEEDRTEKYKMENTMVLQKNLAGSSSP